MKVLYVLQHLWTDRPRDVHIIYSAHETHDSKLFVGVVPQPIASIHTIQLFSLLAQSFLKKKLTCYMLSPSPIDWFFVFEEAWNMGHSGKIQISA